MLPNLQFPVLFFSQPIILKKVTTIKKDFEVVFTIVEQQEILATVQPANKETLNIDSIDNSLIYLEIHSLEVLEINNFIEYKNKNYKIIEKGKYNDYGYNNVIAEESKIKLKNE